MPELIRESSAYLHFVDHQAVRDAQALVGQESMIGQSSRAALEAIDGLRSRATALSLCAEAARRNQLKARSGTFSSADQLSTAAGQLFLRAARLSEGLPSDANRQWIEVRSRVEAAIEFLAAHRLPVAVGVIQLAKLNATSEDPGERLILSFLQLLLEALDTRWLDFQAHAEGLVGSARLFGQQSDSPGGRVLGGAISMAAELLGQYVSGLVNDDVANAQFSLGRLSEVAPLLERFANPEIAELLVRVAGAAAHLPDISIWNLSDELDFAHEPLARAEILTYLKRRGRLFLFPQQWRAIRSERLLRTDRCHVVSMPTGSGKTLLAELLVLQHLLDSHSDGSRAVSKIFFIVPSRALAREKMGEIRELLAGVPSLRAHVCQLTGDVIMNAIEAIRAFDVIVATPEKFDMLLREPTLRTFVGAVVVDEFHNVRSGGRGLRLLALLSRLRYQQDTSRIPVHLVSAIVHQEDLGRVVRWLDGNTINATTSATLAPSQPFRSDEPAMFIRTGIFDLTSQKKDSTWDIDFDDGMRIRVPAPVDAKITVRSQRLAAQHLAVGLLRDRPILLFATSARWRWDATLKINVTDPIKQAIEVKDLLATMPVEKLKRVIDYDKRRQLVDDFRRLFGEHPLLEAIEAGVGAHWGSLPVRARRLIERGVADRALAVVVATSTLAEGVNMPVRAVVIPKCSIRNVNFEVGLFLNLKGRAGRPFMTEEGEIILVACRDTPIDDARFYQGATSADVEPLCSPLAQLAKLEAVGDEASADDDGDDDSNHDLNDLREALDSAALALCVEEDVPGTEAEQFIASRLVISPDELTPSVVNQASSAIQRLQKNQMVEQNDRRWFATPLGVRIYRSGFPPGSAAQARGALGPLVEQLRNIKIRVSDVGNIDFYKVLVALLEVYEKTSAWHAIRRASVKSARQAALYLLHWVHGMPLYEIALRLKSDRLYTHSLLEGTLAPNVAWFLYSLALWLDENPGRSPYIDELVRGLEKLSKYVWFGVAQGPALEILERDFQGRLHRDDVIRFVKTIGPGAWADLKNRGAVAIDAQFEDQLRQTLLNTVDPVDQITAALRDILNQDKRASS